MQCMFKKVIAASVCMLAMFGNAQVSQAEVRTYDGVGEYIMSDFETRILLNKERRPEPSSMRQNRRGDM